MLELQRGGCIDRTFGPPQFQIDAQIVRLSPVQKAHFDLLDLKRIDAIPPRSAPQKPFARGTTVPGQLDLIFPVWRRIGHDPLSADVGPFHRRREVPSIHRWKRGSKIERGMDAYSDRL